MRGEQLTAVPSTHAALHRDKSAHGQVTAEHLTVVQPFTVYSLTSECSLSGISWLLLNIRKYEKTADCVFTFIKDVT